MITTYKDASSGIFFHNVSFKFILEKIGRKYMRNNIYYLLLIGLVGCSSFNTGPLPTVPQAQLPGGKGDNWRYIGTTNDGQLIIEVNNDSIKSASPQVYSFQERKTVKDTSQFQYLSNQVHYKYILSDWLMDCNNKQYILSNVSIFNELGSQIEKIDYSNNSNIKWLKFGSGTIAELEYNYICLNKNRQLGY